MYRRSSRGRNTNGNDDQRLRRVNSQILQLIQMRNAWQQLTSYAKVTRNSACNISFGYSSHRRRFRSMSKPSPTDAADQASPSGLPYEGLR